MAAVRAPDRGVHEAGAVVAHVFSTADFALVQYVIALTAVVIVALAQQLIHVVFPIGAGPGGVGHAIVDLPRLEILHAAFGILLFPVGLLFQRHPGEGIVREGVVDDPLALVGVGAGDPAVRLQRVDLADGAGADVVDHLQIACNAGGGCDALGYGEDHIVGDGIADLIADINDYKPDLICLRRNVMVRMVQYAEDHGLEIYKPKFYAPISEMVDGVTRRMLAKTLGDGLIDAYGVSEMGSFIYEIPGKPYRLVANDIAVANVYNDKNELADDGRILVTSLYKQTYPLINYETMDLGKSFVKDGIRYFTDIEGRVNDLVKHEGGADSSALQLMRIANHTVGLSQFRFIEETYHDMKIQLVADPFNESMTKEEIEDRFITEVTKLYGDEFKITIEWLDELPPDQTGKQRCFVCKVK